VKNKREALSQGLCRVPASPPTFGAAVAATRIVSFFYGIKSNDSATLSLACELWLWLPHLSRAPGIASRPDDPSSRRIEHTGYECLDAVFRAVRGLAAFFALATFLDERTLACVLPACALCERGFAASAS
jgi:hypothetical protein